MCYIHIDENIIVPQEEGKDKFVYTVFDGMVLDIGRSLYEPMSSYEKVNKACKIKGGNLISLDSDSKLTSLVSLINRHKDHFGAQDDEYLIG